MSFIWTLLYGRSRSLDVIKKAYNHHQKCSWISHSSRKLTYAVVNHATSYTEQMSGPHGCQLQLAKKYGNGLDDPKFNPFELYAVLDNNNDKPVNENKGNLDDSRQTFLQSMVCRTEAIPTYNSAGFPVRLKSQLRSFQAGLPAGGLFSVILINGFQYKVTVDDLIIVNKLYPVNNWKLGSIHVFTDNNVLLLGMSSYTLIGMPGVKGSQVTVQVEEITKDEKVIVFKKKRRKNYRRKRGFRRDILLLRVLKIELPDKCTNLNYESRK